MGLLGCSTFGDPATSAKESAIRLHYQTWAVEHGAQCTTPRMAAITDRHPVSEEDGRITSRIRYAYEPAGPGAEDASSNNCRGFDERRFVLERVDGRWNVTYMSGWQYAERRATLGDLELPVRVPPVFGGVTYKP